MTKVNPLIFALVDSMLRYIDKLNIEEEERAERLLRLNQAAMDMHDAMRNARAVFGWLAHMAGDEVEEGGDEHKWTIKLKKYFYVHLSIEVNMGTDFYIRGLSTPRHLLNAGDSYIPDSRLNILDARIVLNRLKSFADFAEANRFAKVGDFPYLADAIEEIDARLQEEACEP